ncbi:restriction endonuclease subunit S [Lachnospiraceae bacterium 56-18]
MGKPKIRFKGFTEEWEQRKLGEIVERITRKNQDLVSTLPLTISAQYGLIDQNEFFDKRVASKDVSGYYLVKKGEFAYNKSTSSDAPWGAVKRLDRYENGVLSTLYIVFAINENAEIDSDYLVTYYDTDLWHRGIREIASEGARNHGLLNIAPADFFETSLSVPQDIEEQKAIGKYFTELNALITLHQRKCDETKKLKKYMLQKMFPQNGMKVPEIRFEGFTGDWEQRKLIDVCDYVDYRGKTPTKIDCGIFLVTAKNVKAGYIDYESSKEYISEDNYEEVMHRGKPKIGDVLITTEAPCGNVAQVDSSNIALAQRIIKYRGHKNEIDNTYLKHYMLAPHFQKLLFEKSSGGTVQGIKGSILHQQYVMYPRYAEQVKIGQYLDTLDHLITLHQRKRDELVKIKKYMLQNMFV